MINVIFSFTPTIPLTDNQKQQLSIGVDYIQIPECIDGTYQAYVETIEHMESLRTQLDSLGSVKIIGVWNLDGTLYGFKKVVNQETGTESIIQIESPLSYPFDSASYSNSLLDEPVIDLNLGIITGYVKASSLKQVNRFAGMPDRQLI